MADPLRSTAPISPAGGNPPHRQPGKGGKETPARSQPEPRSAADQVSVHGGRLVGLQLLRERVLAHTRHLLELPEHVVVPAFAEVPEDETTGEFLGRLLSAQNQLAAQRAGTWDGVRVRRCVDAGLRAGAEEACAILADERRDELALAAAAEVLAEYGRRLQALLDQPVG